MEDLRREVERLTGRLREVEREIERLELGTFRASFVREAAEQRARLRELEAESLTPG